MSPFTHEECSRGGTTSGQACAKRPDAKAWYSKLGKRSAALRRARGLLLSPEQVKLAAERLSRGESKSQVAKSLGVSHRTLTRALVQQA